jgi:steroid delta-isomerase-like uncharacterized protein
MEPGDLVTNLVEAWNAHDGDRLAALYADDFVGIDVAERDPQRGPQGARRTFERYLQGFPDLQLVLRETVVQDNRVAVLWIAKGTHAGSINHIPATGRPIEVMGMSTMTVQDGKLVHATSVWDMAGLLRALGLLPDL